MKNIHPEFAYQANELAVQIEDTLGEPPDRRNYQRVVQSLLGEYASGAGLDDVNLCSFALADQLTFIAPTVLLAQANFYEDGDANAIFKAVSCKDELAQQALISIFKDMPELARQAVITAFLFKNQKRWHPEDHSLDALQKAEDEDENDREEEDDQMTPGYDIEHLFDERGDGHA